MKSIRKKDRSELGFFFLNTVYISLRSNALVKGMNISVLPHNFVFNSLV